MQAGRDIAGNANLKVAGKVVLAVRPSEGAEGMGGLFGDGGDAVVDV